MTNFCCGAAVAAAVALQAAAWPASADAQTPNRTRSIQVKPDNRFGEVSLELQLETVDRADRQRGGVESGDSV